jgi:hypothetical protein
MTCSRDHCGTLNFVECHFITADSLCKRILPSQDPISDSGDIVSARNRVPQRLLSQFQRIIQFPVRQQARIGGNV